MPNNKTGKSAKTFPKWLHHGVTDHEFTVIVHLNMHICLSNWRTPNINIHRNFLLGVIDHDKDLPVSPKIRTLDTDFY